MIQKISKYLTIKDVETLVGREATDIKMNGKTVFLYFNMPGRPAPQGKVAVGATLRWTIKQWDLSTRKNSVGSV